MLRHPPDILITTPESLFLMLTSQARELLRSVDTLILDEVHAVAGTKRGAHLALSRRAARGARDAADPAHRPLGDAAPARGDRALRRRRPADRARRRGRREGARPRGRRPRRGHARARLDRGARASASTSAARATRTSRRARGRRALDLAVDVPGARRARPRAPLDDRLRQQPPPRRAARAAAQRSGRGGDRARASRLARARAADADRGGPEGGPHPVPRRDLVARARHRHGRCRPRDPGRVAEVGRARPAADRPRRPLARRGLAGRIFPKFRADLLECAVVAQRMRGGRDRGDADPAQPARRPRPADRRDLRRRGDRGRRAARPRPRARIRSPSSRAPSSRTSSTCSRAATRPTSSPSCGRGSSGIAPRA